MKIGIFETDHFEVAYTVVKLFDNGKNEIVIFTYEHSYHQLQYLFGDKLSRFTWIIKKPTESKTKFIRKVYSFVKKNKIELMYFNTVSNNFIFYALAIALLRKVRTIVTLHDVNGYFHFKSTLSYRRWFRFVGKRLLIRIVNEFNVISSTMVEYLEKKLPAGKVVHCIPGAVFENRLTDCSSFEISNPLKIVIPGSIDERRRNYAFAFELLENINAKKLPVQMVFLGSFNDPQGMHILEKCQQNRSKNSNLEFYGKSVIDQPEFDRMLDTAHFVFMPSVINTILVDDIVEVYGKTITSGNISDVIKHAKPFIAPAGLQIPENMESSCFRYSGTDHIIAFIEDILRVPEKYKTWCESALKNSLEYTPEKVRERNPSLFYV